MRTVSAEDLDRVFTWPALIEALRSAFRGVVNVPGRHHHAIPLPGEPAAALLLMPAWHEQMASADPSFLGVKVVTVYPGNAVRGKASVAAAYLLLDGRSGEPLAIIDGLALTLWRTAAASALAASRLAHEQAARLVMVGAGNLAPYLIAAHASVRPISDVSIWNRTAERAEELAATVSRPGCKARATTDLEAAVCAADIVSCATLSSEALVRGAWLKPGAHLDLVGAYTPDMRECDDEAVRRARIFVDTRAGALKEAGDILQPLAIGIIEESDIVGDLFGLCRGVVGGRQSADEITLFKSVGTALEDLAAATLAAAALGVRPA